MTNPDTSDTNAVKRFLSVPEQYRLSVAVLIAANVLPIYGILFLGWEVFPVIFLYWLENVFVGCFNVLKMLIASPSSAGTWFSKILMIPFFCVHYGMFTGVHGYFVFMMFGDASGLKGDFPTLEVVGDAIEKYNLVYAAFALFFSHGFSFLFNYIGKEEFRNASVNTLMAAPYGRVVILHLTILLGGFLAMALHSPVFALLLMITMKIAADIWSHLRERKKMQFGRQESLGTDESS